MSKYTVTLRNAHDYVESFVYAKGKGSREKKKLGKRLSEHYWNHKRNINPFVILGPRPKGYLKKCENFNKRSSFIYRDEWGEINLHKCVYSATPIYPKLYVKQARQYELAQIKIKQLVSDKKIPAEFHDRDDKGRGESVNHSIYGWSKGLVLFQVREWKKRYKNYWPEKKISYYLTDGKDVVEITKGKGNIKKCLDVDDSVSAPLRAIKKFLPEEWSRRIKGKDIDWKKKKEVEIVEGYKAVVEFDENKYCSIWCDNFGLGARFEWTPDKWKKQKVKWNKKWEDHPSEGLYFYKNLGKAESFAMTQEEEEEIRIIAIFKCEAKYVQHVTSTKCVASHLRIIGKPVHILRI